MTAIHATRVGRIPVVEKDISCWRCGVTFNPANESVIRSAPCRDCRLTLRKEGDKTRYGSRAEANRKKS